MFAAFAAALLAALPTARAQACQPLSQTPDAVQVAWVAPVGRTVRAGTTLEVVRVSDLRTWMNEHGREPGRVLQALGVARRNPRAALRKDWKVTVFDVRSAWMCRPVDGATPGQDKAGVVACTPGDADALRGHKPGYSGCGYSLDTGASVRGLEVYRITWEDASAQGFCVMPMPRFLGGG
jgi:hypothetical protein